MRIGRRMSQSVGKMTGTAGNALTKLNPLPRSRKAVIWLGGTAKGVAIRIHPNRLAKAVTAARDLAKVDLASFNEMTGSGARVVTRGAKGVGRGAKAATRLPKRLVSKTARRVRSTINDMAAAVSPEDVDSLVVKSVKSAQRVVHKIDGQQLVEAIRRLVHESDDRDSTTGGEAHRRLRKIASNAIKKVGVDRVVRVAPGVVKALKTVVANLDGKRTAKSVAELVAQAKAATGKQARFRLFRLLVEIARETSRAFRKVSGDIEMRDVVVVILVVLATMPELLVALGVSAVLIRIMVPTAQVLLELLLRNDDNSARLPAHGPPESSHRTDIVARPEAEGSDT